MTGTQRSRQKHAMTAKTEVPVGLRAGERETVIRWDDETKTVVIWSASPVVLRKLARMGLALHRESRKRTGELHGREYRVPLAQFRWGLKAKRAALSETHRQRLREGHFSRRKTHNMKGSKTQPPPMNTGAPPKDNPGPEAA
jgi:hypothetical protein